MKTKLIFERVYSDEHMMEIFVKITKPDISVSISCYTQAINLQELSVLCEKFVTTLIPFEWSIGTKEYAYFKMRVEPFDKLGHIKVAISMLNNKNQNNIDFMNCDFFILLDLGQIEVIGNKVLELIDNEYSSFQILQE